MSGLGDGDVIVVLFRSIMTFIVLPAVGVVWWYVKGLIADIVALKERQSKCEQNHAVTTVMMHNIQEDIKEIKYGIEKMLDRRRYTKHEKSSNS